MNDIENKIKSDRLGNIIGERGSLFPHLVINGYSISKNELLFFNLNTSGFLPSISLSFETTNPTFRLKHLPHSGDLINLWIRADSSLFKDISVDFLITSCRTTDSHNQEGDFMTFSLTGVLNIPHFFTDVNYFWDKKTSVDVIIDIADKLGLGFVTNETETDDAMNWVCAMKPFNVFLQELGNRIYKNDTSFFDVWIDYYLNINLLELNKVLSVPDNQKLRRQVIKGQYILDSQKISQTENQYTETAQILTNWLDAKHSNMYFDSFQIINNAGMIESVLGFKKDVSFYDELLRSYQQFEIMPVKTEGAEKDKITMLGRVGEEFWKQQKKKKWLGIHMNKKNVYPMYHVAKYQNLLNKMEIKKLEIKVNLPNLNFNLYKGMMIQTDFMFINSEVGQKIGGNPEDRGLEERGGVLDRSLSGNYLISGINFSWDQTANLRSGGTPDGKWTQTITLNKREWTMPLSPKISIDQLNWIQ